MRGGSRRHNKRHLYLGALPGRKLCSCSHLLQLAQRLGEVGNYDHQARPTDQKSSFWRVPLYTVDALLQLWNETLALAHFDVEVCERVAGSNQSAVLCSAARAVL